MAVSADETAVESDVARLVCRHGAKLRAHEIRLGDAVFIVQKLEDIQLDRLGQILLKRSRTGKQVELFPVDAVREGFAHLIAREMRQKIVDIKDRIGVILTDYKLHRCAVGSRDHAVQCQCNRRPLIFFDAAVIMRFEEAQPLRLIKRMLLEIHARRIDMRGGKIHAVFKRFRPEYKCGKALAAVVVIILAARHDLHSEGIRRKARRFKKRHAFLDAFPLGFAAVEEFHVVRGIIIRRGDVLLGERLIGILGLVEKLVFELLSRCFFLVFLFCHRKCILSCLNRFM